MAKYPNELSILIHYFKKFPGIGAKTAERFVFQLLTWSQEDLKNFSHLIGTLKNQIQFCSQCGCFMSAAACDFCDSAKRDSQFICVISSPKDAYAIEQTRTYKGLYHVIKSTLSPIEGRGLDPLQLEQFKNRLRQIKVQEVILALDSTLEGDATALYLKEQLSKEGIKVSRLAFGLPIGSSLDYIDSTTLGRSFSGRQSF
ncbi:MAG TPA: recombination mediator RecR [Rhabdochlamydiaceae bacterium]|nr:recombination mediator RecR [Rhabdochlamydiaceae bacterium]